MSYPTYKWQLNTYCIILNYMKTLRRHYVEGGTYFFTVITNRRRKVLCDPECRQALRNAISHVRKKHPFEIVAWVLLPDHMHCIWTLPDDDFDFSTRWRLIKKSMSFQMKQRLDTRSDRSESQIKKGESGFWQHRFWEHCIRDENDLEQHFDYIHYNPVKHELVESPLEWEWSTYHKYLKLGFYHEYRNPINFDVGAE